MDVIEPGHRYLLHNADGPGVQELQFVRRLPKEEPREGVLIQEVLRVLIDRIFFLYQQVPCDEDTKIIAHLRECFVLLESRATRRSIEKLLYPERESVCRECHHVACLHREGTRFTP